MLKKIKSVVAVMKYKMCEVITYPFRGPIVITPTQLSKNCRKKIATFKSILQTGSCARRDKCFRFTISVDLHLWKEPCFILSKKEAFHSHFSNYPFNALPPWRTIVKGRIIPNNSKERSGHEGWGISWLFLKIRKEFKNVGIRSRTFN